MVQKFSNGDLVSWDDDGVRRRGTVTASNVDGPADAGDKAGTRFHRVTDEEGRSRVMSEADLAPTDHAP